MNREITNVLSTGLDIYNSVICLVLMFSVSKEIKKDKAAFYFFMMDLCVLLFNLTDISNWTMEGTSHPSFKIFLPVFTFLYYAVVPFCFLFLIKYIQEYLRPRSIKSAFFEISVVLSSFYLAGVIITPFTGFYYKFTPDNYYQRGTFNFVSTIFYAFFYITSVILVIQNRKYLKRRTLYAFLAYSFLPGFFQLLQLKFYGLSLVNIGMTCALVLIFINTYKELQKSILVREDELERRDHKLINFQEMTILSFVNLIQTRQIEPEQFLRRSSILMEKFALQVKKDGFYADEMTDSFVQNMIKAAPLRDVGKIAVSDEILKKPGHLTAEEYEKVKIHTTEGGKIILNLIAFSDNPDFIDIAVKMAENHHERWDGKGYPHKIGGNDIPLCARFTAIIDVFDALVFKRCYKEPVSVDRAFEIIQAEAGSHFDAILVREFEKIKPEVKRLLEIYNG